MVISQELIRVAILWHEMWHEALEEASRLYFTDHNPDGMIAHLEPYHEMLEKGPKTARETSFAQVYGRDLREANEACRRYRVYGEPRDLERAWEIYYGVSHDSICDPDTRSCSDAGFQAYREVSSPIDHT